MAKVTFLPAGVTVEGAPGDTLFQLGRGAGIDVDTACVGKGTCGLCRVRVVDGADHLSGYDEVEEKHLGNVYFLTKVRLACRSRLTGDGDVTVELAAKKKKRRATKGR